ncbi:MAG: hypothetical protein CML44_11570 [Rhodobacteraceae bacterium]|nr:hypothetical protein [Paracoccaceae bacterium]
MIVKATEIQLKTIKNKESRNKINLFVFYSSSITTYLFYKNFNKLEKSDNSMCIILNDILVSKKY